MANDQKHWILFYILPLKLTTETIFKVTRVLDILISLFYFGNFNLREIGFLFFLNFFAIFFFLSLTFASIRQKSNIKHFVKLYLSFRALFFLFNFIVHFMGMLQLAMNRQARLDAFEQQTKLRIKQEDFYNYLNELIIFQAAFSYADLIHLSWTFHLKNI